MNDEQLMTMQHMLSMCLNESNEARRAAEASITTHLNEHREVFIFGLVKLIRSSPEIRVRVLCAIILRQVLPQGDTVLFLKLDRQLQHSIQTELLNAITHEPERYVRSQIADTVAELASVLIHNNNWPGIFEALYTMCHPEQRNDGIKICALSILGKLTDSADNLQPQTGALIDVFKTTMTPNNALTVRVESAVACMKTVGIVEEKAAIPEFQKFLPMLLQVLTDTLNPQHGDEELAKRVLSALTDMATEEGKFFEPILHQLIPMMYAIGSDSQKLDLDDGLRQYACEVLIAIAERAPTMVRKNGTFIKHALMICLSLMLDLEEDADWGKKEDTQDSCDNSNHDFAEQEIDRLCVSVKGAKLWPHLKPMLEQYLSNKNDWRYRYVGLRAMQLSCGILTLDQIPVKELATFINDPHPRVRHATVKCLGQLPIEFEGAVMFRAHKVLYNALVKPLSDFVNPRLQSIALSALVNCVEESTPKQLKNYFESLMHACIALLKQSHQMVQIQVMPLMACLAGQMPDLIPPYYDEIMPLMIYIIEHANTRETRMLRARAMESVSFIGLHVGREKFQPDALKIVNLFLHIMQNAAANSGNKKKGYVSGVVDSNFKGGDFESSDDDYSEQHMLDAWARICQCLKEEFVPLLQYVMPQALATITRLTEGEAQFLGPKGQVHKFDDDGNEQPSEGQDDGEPEDTHVGKDGRVKGLTLAAAANASDQVASSPDLYYSNRAHTTAMEEKASAMGMVISFCFDLKEHFMPYVQQCAEIFIPMLNHPHDEVRSNAIEAMPHLLTSAVAAHTAGRASPEFVKLLFEAICNHMLQMFEQEPDPDFVVLMVVNMQELMQAAGDLCRVCIDAKMLMTMGSAIFKLLKLSHERIARRDEIQAKEEEEGDMDEERIVEFASRNEAEDTLNTQAAKLIVAMIQSHNAGFIDVFDNLFPEVQRMISLNSPPATKRIAVFMLDDVFEHLGELSAKYFPHTIEAMCIFATDMKEEHGLRQASAYGLHVAAKHGGPAFQPYVAEIAVRLVNAIQADPTYLQRDAHEEVGHSWIPKDAEDEGEPKDVDEDDGVDEEEQQGGDDDGEDAYETAEEEDEKSRWQVLDNCVSALGALARYQNRPDLYEPWLQYLPLRNDEVEGPVVYNMLIDLINDNHPIVLGNNFANLPKILSIFIAITGTSFVKNKELRARVNKFFENIKVMPPALLHQVVPQLHQSQQDKLAAIFSSI